MSRKFLVAMAVAVFAFSGAVFAAVENIKVSGDINAEYANRDIALGGAGNSIAAVEGVTGPFLGHDNEHDGFLSQIRLRFDADLTEGVSAVLQLISEREWGEGQDDDIDVNLAYVELKEFFYEPLTMVIGKQNLRYGNALIVGNPDTNQGGVAYNPTGLPAYMTDISLNKSFDAARAVLDYAPWTVDLVFAQVDEGTTSDRRDDEILLGFNVAYDWSSYNGVSELYLFSGDITPQSANVDAFEENVHVVGARTQLDLNDNLTLGLEGAYQFGQRRRGAGDLETIRAWAFQFGSEYRFLNDYNAKIGLGYTLLTGDESKSIESWEGWDPMWEDQTPGELINVLAENTDMHILAINGSMMPREDLTLGLVYCHASRDKKDLDGVYSPVLGPASGYTYAVSTNNQDFGDEIDVYAVYDYTEDVQIKLSTAYFLPGKYFRAGNNNPAHSTRVGINVDF